MNWFIPKTKTEKATNSNFNCPLVGNSFDGTPDEDIQNDQVKRFDDVEDMLRSLKEPYDKQGSGSDGLYAFYLSKADAEQVLSLWKKSQSKSKFKVGDVVRLTYQEKPYFMTVKSVFDDRDILCQWFISNDLHEERFSAAELKHVSICQLCGSPATLQIYNKETTKLGHIKSGGAMDVISDK